MLYKNIYLSDGSCVFKNKNYFKNSYYIKDLKNSKYWNLNQKIKTKNFLEEYKNQILSVKRK